MEKVKRFELRDYLQPGGIYPYKQLPEDMEHYLKQGYTVYVYSVPGFMMAAGHPNLVESSYPWSDGHELSYKTAKDCIDLKNGLTDEELEKVWTNGLSGVISG